MLLPVTLPAALTLPVAPITVVSIFSIVTKSPVGALRLSANTVVANTLPRKYLPAATDALPLAMILPVLLTRLPRSVPAALTYPPVRMLPPVMLAVVVIALVLFNAEFTLPDKLNDCPKTVALLMMLPPALNVPVMATVSAVTTRPEGAPELLNSCTLPTHMLLPPLTARLPRLLMV